MSGGAPPVTTQKTTTELGPEQKAIFNAAFPYASNFANNPLQLYGGTGIAAQTPEEAAAQNRYLMTSHGTAQDLANSSALAQKTMLDPNLMLDPANNPYLQRSAAGVSDAATRDFLQKVLPNIRGGTIQAGGMYSGGASKGAQAEALGAAETGKNVANTVADMYSKAYGQGLDTMKAAQGMNSQVMAGQLMPADMEAAVGAQKRAEAQAQLDEVIRRFYGQQELPYDQASMLMSLISGMPGGTTVSTGTGAVPKVNPLMASGSGAATGAMIGSIFPGVGTAIGAGVGGLGGYLLNRFS
jgi:hypothetical protein